ncbi:MAG: hypothetical protein NT064_04440 [Proteobacteria bacterium]|nr:hypothetical protein [Pseudomonadota bacterium]
MDDNSLKTLPSLWSNATAPDHSPPPFRPEPAAQFLGAFPHQIRARPTTIPLRKPTSSVWRVMSVSTRNWALQAVVLLFRHLLKSPLNDRQMESGIFTDPRPIHRLTGARPNAAVCHAGIRSSRRGNREATGKTPSVIH